jgi:plastocyanin
LPVRSFLRFATFVVALGLFRAGCSSSAPPPASTPAPVAATAASGTATVAGRTVPGALVMLEPASGEPPLPDGPAILDQYGKQFVPGVLFVRVGQRVEFRNSEDVDHNVRVIRNPTGTMVMDESGSQNQVFTHTFEQPGTFEVSCDIHPGMRATIVASRTPFAVETDAAGGFTIERVPAGAFVLKVLAAGRETSQPVTVVGPRTDLGTIAR